MEERPGVFIFETKCARIQNLFRYKKLFKEVIYTCLNKFAEGDLKLLSKSIILVFYR